MDAKNLLESLDFSKENVNRQALVYSFSNILTLSMLSNFGIKYDISDKTIETFLEKLNKEFNISNSKEPKEKDFLSLDILDSSNNKEKKFSIDTDFYFVKNLTPIKAIYSKTYFPPSSEIGTEPDIDFSLKLNDVKFEKRLSPKNQGLLILNELNLSKVLYNKGIVKRNRQSGSHEKLIGMFLLDLAITQGEFCHDNLRNTSNFFVEKENISSVLDEINLKETNSKTNWEDQVYMLLAYAKLYEILNTPKYKNYLNSSEANLFKSYALDLLNILKQYEYEIIDLETGNLSSLISSIIEALNILDNERKHIEFVLSLCDELCAREKKKGFMLSYKHTKEAASLASHFKSIEALTSGFEYTNYNLFLNASEDIYNNINSIWDNNLGLFNLEGKDSIRYSSKSISYVLKSLNKLLKATTSSTLKERIKHQLTDFFDSSINGAGLQSPPPSLRMDMNMFRSSDAISSVVEDIIQSKKVYIIEKGFEINKNNNQIIKDSSNELSSEHTLLASDAMLSLVAEEG